VSRLETRTIPADMTTPVAVMRKLMAGGEESFLLESVEGGAHLARYSFLGTAPRARLSVADGVASREEGGRTETLAAPFLDAVHAAAVVPGFSRGESDPPFSAGAVGYLSYDAVRLFERIPQRHPRASKMPDGLFLVFDSVVAFDHARGVMVLQSIARDGEGEGRAAARLDALERRIARPDPPGEARPRTVPAAAFVETGSREGFLSGVARAQQAIAAGEIYQIQISRRWQARLPVDAFDVYRSLRRVNPSPYQFFLRTREGDILGASPEMLVRIRGRGIETRPIAGTYPRGASPAEDRELEARFLADPKERAEHVMLVDLARNDLGRVCEAGTVEVPEFFTVEKYSHVQHLVSSVTGRLAGGVTALQALAASFPAGTLTGAPKIRAMELIDELETERRGIYGGAVGYIDAGGDLDSAIAIRTMVVEDGVARVQAAAGIVMDSVPEREARETEIKSGALFRAVEAAGGLG
jgi:anthranilate synthase component 1